MISAHKSTASQTSCYHCGSDCPTESIRIEEKRFCCNGCKSVFQILNANDLCDYYALNEQPGFVQNELARSDKFQFLDNEEIKRKLIQYSNGQQSQLTLYLPQIHCSSCLWLLENITVLDKGISTATVNFTKKEIFIVFDESKTTLRKVVETLTKIGYEPHLSLNDLSKNSAKHADRERWYKIGVAGFCFANIMMMSLGDYLSFSSTIDPKIQYFFSAASLLLTLPVLFYAATEFFVSAWSGLKNRYLNIDLPVALALVITFLRSCYEIYFHIGSGYLDSLSGIVFFMLIGRWLQARTYQTISFDRDYKSFFPIAINVIKDGSVVATEISAVRENDLIQIHGQEIIPVDAMLSKGTAKIDYSFVSGESQPVAAKIGEMIYAGGKQLEGMIELVVIKPVSQSYLTNLWNNPIFNKRNIRKSTIYDVIGKYFTYLVLAIGLFAGVYWQIKGEQDLMWNAITTVLIVACPCALLLSQNYTQGNILRILGLNRFYLRSADVIEELSHINHIVLDKTGTLTQAQGSNVRYSGILLSPALKSSLASLIQHSSHPASKAILSYLNETELKEVTHYKESEGKGIEGWVNDQHIKVGSATFVGAPADRAPKGTDVWVYADQQIVGKFTIHNKYRFGVTKLLASLKQTFTLSLISGDNDTELENIETLLGKESEIHFNQSPAQKMEYIQDLQNKHHLHVMMIGDGLNDAGALKLSNVGIAVADTANTFTPSSDGVIDGASLARLDTFISFARAGKKIVFITFACSVIYNLIGLYYAVQGILSPVIAAILMPSSSITIILLTYGLTEWLAYQYDLKKIN